MGPTTAGYVLVGGRSTRFGADKALAPWRGRPLAVWVAEQVRDAAGSATLVGDPERYQSLGLPTIPDAVTGFGPLAGVSAALNHSPACWTLVVGCDMPNLSSDFLVSLLRLAATAAADLLLPTGPDGLDQPLCAAYSTRCRQPIADAVRRGVHKMTDGFAGLDVRRFPVAQAGLFLNLNTPADLAAAEVHG